MSADSGPVVSPATAQALELPSLLAVVAEHAATDLGRRRVLDLAPFTDRRELDRRRRSYEEVRLLLDGGRLVGPFDRPLGELLEQARRGEPPLGGGELVRFGDLLRATAEARDRILSAEPPVPELSVRAGALPDLSELRRHLSGRLDRRGRVRDDATPHLAELRRRIRRVRDSLYKDLEGVVEESREHLSEETIPLRGGRLVLMLSAGARGRVPGLVHGRSGTGKSFYFEPLSVVESNNTLQTSVEEEEAERARIVAELSARVREELPALEEHADLLSELDLLQASVGFAEACRGRLVEESSRGDLRMVGARHPLLEPGLSGARERALGAPGHTGEVVPLELVLTPDRRALVVTGPNAGGKTVALKTLGLLALATQCGLPVPAAAGSRLPFFQRLVATVGDEQDLLADRSTFSGRLLRLKEAWEGAGPDSLVLLDELGSGTDPEEGAALSVALLEGLLESSCTALITTHLTQLAAAALELPGATCAAMEFDAATGEPTFRLVAGAPGGSEALALARRLGLPRKWLDRAEARLGSEHRELRRLLSEVESLRQELAEERRELARERDALAGDRRRLAEEAESLAEERRRVARRLKAELEEFRVRTRKGLAEEVERLKEELAAGRRKDLAAEATARLFEGAPELPETEEPAEGPIEVGGRVRHRLLGWEGVLERLDGERAEIQVRGKRLTCGRDELVAAGDAPEAPRPAAGRRKGPVRGPEVPDVAPELNLIGRRVEPALAQLDAYLDQALLASRESVRVIHGHGTGRLRDAVRQHLKSHAAVASARPGQKGEGGDGATVVTLRESP